MTYAELNLEPRVGDRVIERHTIAQDRIIESVWPEQGYANAKGVASGRSTRIRLDRLRTRYDLVHRP